MISAGLRFGVPLKPAGAGIGELIPAQAGLTGGSSGSLADKMVELQRQGYSLDEAFEMAGGIRPPPDPGGEARRSEEKREAAIEQLKLRQNEIYIKLRNRGALGTDIEHEAAEGYKNTVGSYPDWYRPPGLMRSIFGNAEPEGY